MARIEPTAEKIQELKSKFSDRSLNLVEVDFGEGDVQCFVMTGPTRDEYKMFLEAVLKADKLTDKGEMTLGVRAAVENCALAQIRWPDRAEVQAFFSKYVEIADGFSEHIHKAAGANAEVRSKKL